MKKIFAIMGAALFMLGFGIAYAGSGLNNGVTDFTGKTYDVLETAPAAVIGHTVFGGSAAGGILLVENDKGELHNGITDFSGRTNDTLEISTAPSVGNFAEGSAAGGLRRNLAGEKSSVRSYDSLEMVW
jgi:hypothetical protein